MKFRVTLTKADFFKCVKESVEKAIARIRKCYEQTVKHHATLTIEDLNQEKLNKALRVEKFEVKDVKRGFSCNGETLGATPAVDQLLSAINHLQHLFETMELYTSPPFPDEALQAHILLTHQRLAKPTFQVEILVRRKQERLYSGNISTNANVSITEEKEIQDLLQGHST